MTKRDAYYRINHKKGLENLCNPRGLLSIDEDPEEIRIIIKEPSYQRRHSIEPYICPDLFLGYYNHDWTVIELKHSRKKSTKARKQIESGKRMLVDVFGIPLQNITGKLVIYDQSKFKYKIV